MKVTEDVIAHQLRKRYGTGEWAFMCQVRNATGIAGQARYADALAFGLWPSRGQEILGFEIKVSRQDWQKERETPAKAEAIARFCDRWWIVAPVGIVRKDELPAGWGLMELEGETQLKVAKDAPKLEPQEPKRGFWCSVMRAFSEQVDVQAQIKKQVELASHEARVAGAAAAHLRDEAKIKQLEENVVAASNQVHASRAELREVLYATGCTSLEELRRLPLRQMVVLAKEVKRVRSVLGDLQYRAKEFQESLPAFDKDE